MKNLWLVVVLSGCGVFASAQTKEYPYTSGNAFVRVCSSVEKIETSGTMTQPEVACIFYINGLVDGVGTGNITTMVQMKPTTVPKPFCRPEVEMAQMVKIVLKYIREHPEEASKPTGFLALWAFQKAFPCK
jgi:hypothetical protein